MSSTISSEDLPASKCHCMGCGKVCDRVMRPQYEEITVENSSQLCMECFQKELGVQRELWKEGQRAILGPSWDGYLTLKKIIFKRPISLSTNSNAVTSTPSSVGVSSLPTMAPKETNSGVIDKICLLILLINIEIILNRS